MEEKETKYLRFKEIPFPDRATEGWHVFSKASGALLGMIAWYAPWRQYCYMPEGGMVFNATCLDDIEEHIRDRQNMWRKAKGLDIEEGESDRLRGLLKKLADAAKKPLDDMDKQKCWPEGEQYAEDHAFPYYYLRCLITEAEQEG